MATFHHRLSIASLGVACCLSVALAGCSQAAPEASPPSGAIQSATTMPPVTTPIPTGEEIKKQIAARYQAYLEGYVHASQLNPVEQRTYLLEWVSPRENEYQVYLLGLARDLGVTLSRVPIPRLTWRGVTPEKVTVLACQDTYKFDYIQGKSGPLSSRPIRKVGRYLVFKKNGTGQWMITEFSDDAQYTEKACS